MEIKNMEEETHIEDGHPSNLSKGNCSHTVLCSSWSLEDRINEIEEILRGTSVRFLEGKLLEFVEQKIEPAGWKAIWRYPGGDILSKSINFSVDFLVDVINVSQESLNALILIVDIIKSSEDTDLKPSLIDKKVFAPLFELYPYADQENKIIDIETTVDVIDHLRFIRENIVLPWDIFEDVCHYDRNLIARRLEIYENKRKGIIPRNVSEEMNNLKRKGKRILDEIKDLENKDDLLDKCDIDERDVVQLMELNKEMERVKHKYEMLQNPVLRELTIHQESIERKKILASSSSEEPANILVASTSLLMENFLGCIARLPDLLKQLPKVPEVPMIKTFPSLQIALDVARTGDIIALLPGTHQLKHLGALSRGGTLLGLNDEVKIIGSSETGDLVLDLNLSEGERFGIHSITLKPLEEQTGIFLHRGDLLIENCCIEEGAGGLVLLSGSECKIKNTKFSNLYSFGIESKSGSEMSMESVFFHKCSEAALKWERGAKITVVDKARISECRAGVLLSGGGELEQEFNSSLMKMEEKIETVDVEKKFSSI